MALEIEKKYLIFKDKLPKLRGGILYIQGYLCLSPLIRFRICENKVCLNVKKIKKNSPVREEWEFYNNLNDIEIKKLIRLSIKKPIQKIRYRVKHASLIWEIDVYQGENKGLITAELELPKKDYSILFPNWVDNKHEISNDQRYFNKNLGDCPYKLLKNDLKNIDQRFKK